MDKQEAPSTKKNKKKPTKTKKIKKKIRLNFNSLKSRIKKHKSNNLDSDKNSSKDTLKAPPIILDLNETEFDKNPNLIFKLSQPKKQLANKMNSPKTKIQQPKEEKIDKKTTQGIQEINQKDLLNLDGHELTKLKNFVFEESFKGLPTNFHRDRKNRYGW